MKKRFKSSVELETLQVLRSVSIVYGFSHIYLYADSVIKDVLCNSNNDVFFEGGKPFSNFFKLNSIDASILRMYCLVALKAVCSDAIGRNDLDSCTWLTSQTFGEIIRILSKVI